MPYSQYTTLHSVRQKLGVTTHFAKWLPVCEPVKPSTLLEQVLERHTRNRTAYFNEKSRSEEIVFPVLSELQVMHGFKFALYSGANMEGERNRA